MFVRQGRERNRRESATFQPVNCRGVDGYCFFRRDVGTILNTKYKNAKNFRYWFVES